MKKQIARILLIAMLAVFVLGAAPHALAVEETANIFNLKEKSHMMVNVEYTAGAPTVHFLSPDGTVYDGTAVNEGKMRVQDDNNVLTYWIPNAEPGQWQIVYDKGANSKLNITWSPYVEALTIRSFTYQPKDGDADRLEAKLDVNYINNCWYRYRIYAALTDGNGTVTGTRELTDGSGYTNETNEFSVNISSLATYDQYYLQATVEVDDYGTTVSDTRLGTTSFAYTNTDMPEAMKGVQMEINVSEETLTLNWNDFAVSCSGYVLAVYADGEALYANRFDSGVRGTAIPLDLTAGKLQVQLGYLTSYSGAVSALLTREVDLSFAKAVTVETADETADSHAKIVYDFSVFGGDVDTVVTVNEQSERFKLSGSNTMTAALDLFDNELSVSWYLDAETCFTVQRSIYFDNIAPLLKLPELTGMAVTEQDTYILVGYTDIGCTVKVNEQAVETDENGSFTVSLELEEGLNDFTVVATNVRGISAAQSFSVTRTNTVVADDGDNAQEEENTGFIGKLQKFLPIILAFLAGVTLIVFVLCAPKAFRRRKENKGMRSALLWLGGYAMTFVDILLAGFAGWRVWNYISDNSKLTSMEFYDAANNSVGEAFELLERNKAYKESMILWLCVFGGAVLLTVVLYILAAVLKKKGDGTDDKVTPEIPVPEMKAEEPAGESEIPLPEMPVFPETSDDKPENSATPEMAPIPAPVFAEEAAVTSGDMKPLDMENLEVETEEQETPSLDIPNT